MTELIWNGVEPTSSENELGVCAMAVPGHEQDRESNQHSHKERSLIVLTSSGVVAATTLTAGAGLGSNHCEPCVSGNPGRKASS